MEKNIINTLQNYNNALTDSKISTPLKIEGECFNIIIEFKDRLTTVYTDELFLEFISYHYDLKNDLDLLNKLAMINECNFSNNTLSYSFKRNDCSISEAVFKLHQAIWMIGNYSVIE